MAEFDTLTVPANQPITLTVKPATIKKTGVYTGSITVHLVQATMSGHTENVTIPVKVVATDGPWWPFAVVLIGVLLATWTVNWRTTNRHKTLLHLRAAELKRRLSTMIADAHDQAFSERLATRIKEKLRETRRKWQELDLDGAQGELDEIETTLEDYVKALALINDAEGILDHGREQFLSLGGDANRRLAGEAWLEEARIALDIGDVANAKSHAEYVLQVYGQAFGLYSRLKDLPHLDRSNCRETREKVGQGPISRRASLAAGRRTHRWPDVGEREGPDGGGRTGVDTDRLLDPSPREHSRCHGPCSRRLPSRATRA